MYAFQSLTPFSLGHRVIWKIIFPYFSLKLLCLYNWILFDEQIVAQILLTNLSVGALKKALQMKTNNKIARTWIYLLPLHCNTLLMFIILKQHFWSNASMERFSCFYFCVSENIWVLNWHILTYWINTAVDDSRMPLEIVTILGIRVFHGFNHYVLFTSYFREGLRMLLLHCRTFSKKKIYWQDNVS